MNTERNCQFCKSYKNEYCDVLDMKPCYPELGCDYFSEQECERKFEEIMVDYPPAKLCTYPEYRGKPYFSIKYEENGEHIIGFGTYKPEVLSRYLREYFIEADKESGEKDDKKKM